MQFTPKTEHQLIEESLLPAGEYDFRVISAEDTTSKSSGKPMIALELEVFDENGKGRRVRDYLMESMGFKLRHFAFATGLGGAYESGDMGAAQMPERFGKLVLKVEDGKNGYAPRNGVKDYVVPEADAAASTAAAKAPVKPATAALSDQDPPF